jgi:hypothetical protein
MYLLKLLVYKFNAHYTIYCLLCELVGVLNQDDATTYFSDLSYHGGGREVGEGLACPGSAAWSFYPVSASVAQSSSPPSLSSIL